MRISTVALTFVVLLVGCSDNTSSVDDVRVVVESDGWDLIGDLRLPYATGRVPAVLMLNQAAGDRQPYAELARHLSDRGIGSLRIDLRGHGESVNQGRFIPGRSRRDSMIWDAEVDVAAALEFMRSHPGVNGASIGLIGASYSGEEAAEAARNGYAASVYVFLSPGSFSDESVWSVDSLDVPWLFVSAREDRHLADISAAVAQHGQNAEITLLPGSSHATDLLAEYPDLPERIAVWLAERLVGIGMSPVE